MHMPAYKHYFIRHAHRKDFKPNDWGHEVPITDQGQKASQQLGESFANSQITAFWTSPIKRCIQTAEGIQKGMGIEAPIRYSSLLGDPGFLISDPKIAEKAFGNYQLFELVDLLLEGKSISGFYPLDIGCRRVLKKLFESKQSTIWITHDIIICILACWIFHRDRSENMIPEFLEGIEFSFENTGVFVHFKGLRTKMDETLLRGTLASREKPASSNRQ